MASSDVHLAIDAVLWNNCFFRCAQMHFSPFSLNSFLIFLIFLRDYVMFRDFCFCFCRCIYFCFKGHTPHAKDSIPKRENKQTGTKYRIIMFWGYNGVRLRSKCNTGSSIDKGKLEYTHVTPWAYAHYHHLPDKMMQCFKDHPHLTISEHFSDPFKTRLKVVEDAFKSEELSESDCIPVIEQAFLNAHSGYDS